MSPELVNAANAFDGLAGSIKSTWPEGRAMGEALGAWNQPQVTVDDLVARAQAVARRIREIKEGEVSDALRARLTGVPQQIAWLQSNQIPQLPGGNAQIVVANLVALFSTFEALLPGQQAPSWEEIEDSKLVPKQLAQRIRSLEATIERLEPRVGELDKKVVLINDAHAAAENLPTDLAALEEATNEVRKLASTASDASSRSTKAEEQAAATLGRITQHEQAAAQLVANCENAYSAATTVGLAASFTERASSLNQSTRAWVALLLVALAIAGGLGFYRLMFLQTLLTDKEVAADRLWLNAAMSFFAIAAPVWFAWVATKQIAQRFRLAEDYAFKASVARAYEGYRREAARLDTALEARLFASALDRLDEPPLRFVATEEHSTPYQELLNSRGFHKALEKLPDFRESLSALIARSRGNAAE